VVTPVAGGDTLAPRREPIMKAKKWEILSALGVGAIVGAAAAGWAFQGLGCAHADTPNVMVQPCSGTMTVFGFPHQGAPSETWHSVPAAIVDLPGRTWQDLYASVTVVPSPPAAATAAPQGFVTTTQATPPFPFAVKDGEVAVGCAAPLTAQSTVTFVVH
jgi:hypothetical protein